MRINREETIALVVDVQEKLMPVIWNGESITEHICLFLKGLSILGVPNIVTQQYTSGLGQTLDCVRGASDNINYIDKISFSCLDNEEFRNQLEAKDRKVVLVIGVEAHICVLQTVIDLKAAGYVPVLVVDCISSRREEDRQAAIWRARQEDVLLTTSEAILFELTRRSGTKECKEILRLVK